MSQSDLDRLYREYRQQYLALITLDQAAEIAHSNKGTLYDWSSRGLLDGFKTKRGRRVLLDLFGFLRFLAAQPQ